MLDNAQTPRTSPRRSHGFSAAKPAEPRPDIDVSFLLPDFHDELRWPLSGMNHPTLEPRFPIAQELAVGVDWQQLCARGVQNRVSATQKELLGYLQGWCEVQKRNVDGACTHLKPLLGSMKSGMRTAVRQDLANILVDQGSSEKAEHWLSKHDIRDVATLDLLAASYVELGLDGDAFAINRRAIDSDDYATAATKCKRLVKRIVLGYDHEPELAAGQLKSMVVNTKAPDKTCQRLWNKVACWRDHSKCTGFHDDENIPASTRLLLDAYDAWPSGPTTSMQWWSYTDMARLALPNRGAADLVVSAMEATLRAAYGTCFKGIGASFHHAINDVRAAPDGGRLEARLQAIEKVCPKPPPPPPPPPPTPIGSPSAPPASLPSSP
jgi:hypothetical protein